MNGKQDVTSFVRVFAASRSSKAQIDTYRERNAMDDVLQVELTTHERDVLLRGLRFVRRSVMLETREPSKEDELRRSGILDEIHMLSQRLEATGPVPAAEL